MPRPVDDDEHVQKIIDLLRKQLAQLADEKLTWSAKETQWSAKETQWSAERKQWDEERESLSARIVQLKFLLQQAFQGRLSEKRTTEVEQQLLGGTVDAGLTGPDAESKQQEREQRAAQGQGSDRALKKKRKNDKKGKAAGGGTKPANGGGRRPVNKELPLLTTVIEVPPAERTLADGTPLIRLGFEEREMEFYQQAMLHRLIIRREILGTADTRQTVVTAPVPPQIVPRGKYHDSLIIEAMIRKYLRGMPFYRVLQDFRAMGSDLSDAQLSDLAQRFGTFLTPVASAIRDQVLADSFAHVDETPLPTQDGGCYLWGVRARSQVFFHVSGRSGNALRTILGMPLRERAPDEIFLPPFWAPDAEGPPETGQNPVGSASKGRHRPDTEGPAETTQEPQWSIVHMMADGYAVYDVVLEEAGIRQLSCWVHARRGLLPCAAAPPIADILDAIGGLYAVEAEAKRQVEKQALTGASALAVYARLRHERSKHQLAAIQRLLTAARQHFTEGSEPLKAINYCLNRWPSLIAYADDGGLPVDNNDAERALRMIVIGRKNWMLIGSEDACPHAAAIFTVLESCRLSQVEPRAYLAYVVERLHAGDTAPAELTPERLAARFPQRS